MRNSVRIFALMLCLVLFATCVFAMEPTRLIASTEPNEDPITASVELTETTAAGTEATEPPEPVTEPAEPVTESPEPDSTEPTEPTEKPVSEMTDEEIIEKYSIPDYWARKALIFSVRSGIMVGRGNNDLAPSANITHAELITILMSIMKTEKEASLSRFTDLEEGRWYYVPMAKAVSLGILPLANPNATTLTPSKPITREEAFVAMARMFGVHSPDRQAIYRFADWKNVSDWAANDLAAMIEICHITGDGTNLMPKNNITRAEIVQVLSRLLTKIGTTLDETDFTGQMGLGGSTVAPNTTINGDLLLSTDETVLCFEGLTVTGRLILQGNNKVTVTLKNCTIHELVVCRPADIYCDTLIKILTVHQFVNLFSEVQTLNLFDRLALGKDFTVQTVNAYTNSAMTVLGTVHQFNVFGDNVYINGSGSIDTLTIRGKNNTDLCPTGKVVQNPYRTTKDAVATRTDGGVVSDKTPELTLKLKLTNMPEGWSECDLVWFVDGREISRTFRNLLQEGSVISAKHNFSSFLDGFHSSVQVTVYITNQGVQTLLYKGSVKVDDSVQANAHNVRTQNIQGKLRTKCNLFTSRSMTSVIRSIPAGTQVSVLQSRQATATQVRLSDGTTGWVNYYNVQILDGTYYVTQDYTTAVKEYYVNRVRKCSSKTKYLIWVSLYTQRINIFQGSKGNWKLIRSGPIASGRNDCPTPVEVTTILYKTNRWSYEPYYVHHVSVFDEARGFHSRPTAWNGSVYSYAIGYPASNGCVRLLDEECVFIYDYCPIGTAVYIY